MCMLEEKKYVLVNIQHNLYSNKLMEFLCNHVSSLQDSLKKTGLCLPKLSYM